MKCWMVLFKLARPFYIPSYKFSVPWKRKKKSYWKRDLFPTSTNLSIRYDLFCTWKWCVQKYCYPLANSLKKKIDIKQYFSYLCFQKPFYENFVVRKETKSLLTIKWTSYKSTIIHIKITFKFEGPSGQMVFNCFRSYKSLALKFFGIECSGWR